MSEVEVVDPVHVMVDLETWGTGNDAMIVSIGAVKFNPFKRHEIDSVFYTAIDTSSYPPYAKRVIDPKTIDWWMDPAQQNARDALARDEKVDINSALYGFINWFGNESLPVWGNGATFDNVILRNTLEVLGFEVPWTFRDDRCFRTFRRLAPSVKAEPVGVIHHALHDAQSQAYQMQDIVWHLSLRNL